MTQRIALGTVQFGLDYGIANQSGRVGRAAAASILQEAAAQGMSLLDTAINYGESEQVLGSIGVGNWRIVTKLPAVPKDCADVQGWVDTQVEQSLERLGTKRLHGVLLHRPEQLLGRQGKALARALHGLKAQGHTDKVGVSVYEPSELAPLSEVMSLDLVQIPMNILDRRLVSSGWTDRLSQRGSELHVRSVFLQGLLLIPAPQRPAKFNRWQPIWLAWDRWLLENNLTPLQACLRYALSVTGVDQVVVGVDTISQLHEILAAANGALPDLPDWPDLLDADLLNPARWNQL